MDKYLNEAIIGNQRIVASYSKQGELLRAYYPSVDYKQIIDFFLLYLIFWQDTKLL